MSFPRERTIVNEVDTVMMAHRPVIANHERVISAACTDSGLDEAVSSVERGSHLQNPDGIVYGFIFQIMPIRCESMGRIYGVYETHRDRRQSASWYSRWRKRWGSNVLRGRRRNSAGPPSYPVGLTYYMRQATRDLPVLATHLREKERTIRPSTRTRSCQS